MTHQIGWWLAGKVLPIEIEGAVDVAELGEIMQTNARYFAQGDPPVHLLVDVLKVQSFPTNLVEMRKLEKFDQSVPVGWVVIITTNILMRFIGSMSAQLGGAKVRHFPTIDEAITFRRCRAAQLRGCFSAVHPSVQHGEWRNDRRLAVSRSSHRHL